jgi:hypothetical protein
MPEEVAFAASPSAAPLHSPLYLDDDLLADDSTRPDLRRATLIVREAVSELLAREGGIRLARLGGSEPDLEAAPWRP